MSALLGAGGGGSSGTTRTILSALNTTYYVRTTGNNSNNGTTPGTAWLTLDHAMFVISTTLDLAGNQVTVDIGAGSFPGCQILPCVGGGDIYFVGAGSTLTTITSSTSGNGACFVNFFPLDVEIWVNKLKCAPTTVSSDAGSFRSFGACEYFIADPNFIAPTDMAFVGNPNAQACIYMQAGNFTDEFAGGTITISGSHGSFVLAEDGGRAGLGNTYVMSGTPSFSTGFLQTNHESFIFFTGPTSGAFTGSSFSINSNSCIVAANSDAVTFPGASAKGVITSGIYSDIANNLNWTWFDNMISPATGATVAAWDKTNGALALTAIASPAGTATLNVAGGSNMTGGSSVPAAQFTQKWNNAGTSFSGVLINVTNTASAATSKVLDVQINGTSQFRIDPNGNPDLLVAGRTYNYLGQPIAFMVANASGDNFFLGEAGNFTVSGQANFGEGPGALASVTTGTFNLAMGQNALTSLQSGTANMAMGIDALHSNVSGGHNAAVGVNALRNCTGSNNVGIGDQAGHTIGAGIQNVAVGSTALGNLNGGSNNTGIGYNVGGSLVTASGSVMIGSGADPAADNGNTIIIATGFGNTIWYKPLAAGADGVFLPQIYTNKSDFILRNNAGLTNNAAAQTATLTNAPVAGNPTKWVAYDDNGTTRYIPMW